MSDVSVLKRKLAPPVTKALASVAIEAVFRKSMPRDADALLGLNLLVQEVSFGKADRARVLEGLGEGDLTYLLQDGGGRHGLCTLSDALLSGLIEAQVSGRVSDAPVVPRPPTRTDAIVTAGIVDRWMASAERVALEDGIEPPLFAGYTRQEGRISPRNAGLLIEQGGYLTLAITLILDNGKKTGTVRFAVPARGAGEGNEDFQLSRRMERNLSDLHAPLRAVLARLPHPMAQVRDLAVGDVIAVPGAALTSVRLEGIDGTLIARGRLGQVNDLKAVRISFATSPAALGMALSPPTAGALPDAPGADLPDLPPGDLPDLPDVPDVPDLPGGDLPELPDLPDLPDGALPDLPDLPDLPGEALSDLPDLPPLPDPV